MTTILGRDWGANTLARFGGRLMRATLHRETSTPDPDDPTTMNVDSVDYVCDAMPFKYEMRNVDGEHVHKGDYRVSILRASISAVSDDAVRASLNLADATGSFSVGTVVEAVQEGDAGNVITVELIDDAIAAIGTLTERGTNARLSYLSGSTTVAQLEALIATSALIRVKTPGGTQGYVLLSADEFASDALSGGLDATLTQAGIVPTVDDSITIPPPGETTPKRGRIVHIDLLNEAQVTVQVRGVGA